MARKSSRPPRAPAAPPPAARPQPRRPVGTQAPSGQSSAPAARTEADYAQEYSHVRRDLKRIAAIAVVMFGIIFAAPHFLK
jgi:hypothetical protein